MKFFHLADLHLGKVVHGFSMLADQRYVLEQVLQAAHQQRPAAVLLAGDLYDPAGALRRGGGAAELVLDPAGGGSASPVWPSPATTTPVCASALRPRSWKSRGCTWPAPPRRSCPMCGSPRTMCRQMCGCCPFCALRRGICCCRRRTSRAMTMPCGRCWRSKH